MEATQPLTQPYTDPRRLGRNNSEVSEDDAADVICILHPNSPAAYDAVLATMLTAPQHILQNEDLHDLTEDDLLRPEFMPSNTSRDIALRISSTLKNPAMGFVFGRNKSHCDILLVENEQDKNVSNMHFTMFLNDQGTLMLQDTSTNGTVVDDDHIRKKDKNGVLNKKPATRMINSGVLICVVGPEKAEIKFLVRTPKRGNYESAFHANLTKYVSAHSKSQVSIAPFAQNNTFGMHWNGGSKYNIVGLLGKGAFATVYRVATTDEGLLFAAKELDKRKFLKNGVLDLKFDNEIQIMKHLRHPNIVQYIDFQDHEQWVYIIMEFVPHGELSKFMQEKGPVAEQSVRIITCQILHALDYLHRRNITHRDIKPDNILVASVDPLVVKLSDFGLSKCVTNEETFLKTFCGTLLYCAPEIYPEYASYQQGDARKRRRLGEQVRKTSPYDQSVDMWSFGAVLFHILCGKAPIIGRGDDKGAQMLNNIMTKDVDFEPLRQKHVSEAGIDFIGRLLNRNPLMRPKERECFKHPWIRDLAEVMDDMEEEIPIMFSQGLEPVEEAEESYDEDEEDAYRTMFGLPEKPAFESSATKAERLDTRHEAKRRRLSWHDQDHLGVYVNAGDKPPSAPPNEHVHLAGPGEQPGHVIYPELPEPTEDATNRVTATRGDRLYGEITPSVLRSSGVFGIAAPAPLDVPAIREAVEQISVNDFATFNDIEAPLNHEEQSERQLQYPQALALPTIPGSAPSLLGAEAQIGMMNMASPQAGTPDPDVEVSEGTTPDTTNPVTPKTREATPSDSNANSQNAGSTHTQAVHKSPPRVKFSRKVDLDLLEDEVAHAASMRAREASRVRMRERKANTFHYDRGQSKLAATQLAVTLDGRTRHEEYTGATASSAGGKSATGPVEAHFGKRFQVAESQLLITSGDGLDFENGFVRPQPRLGKLSTVSGSFINTTIHLSRRMTSWGRDKRCTIEYLDKQDTRIPKAALQITFWAPGVEAKDGHGDEWMMVPRICTMVSTSTSRCIWINDVELRAQSNDGDAALYGKIYTGDIVTIFKSQDPTQAFLKFRVEINYGDSAKYRPENEQGFQVQREMQHHRRFVEAKRSMNESGKENNGQTMVREGVSD